MIAIEQLARLALGDLDDAEAAAVEEHVLSCGACASVLERLVRLGIQVQGLVRGGAFAFPVTEALRERLRAAGLLSRSYRIAPEQSVPCAVGEHDVYSLTTLEADLSGVTRANLLVVHPWGELRLDDVPFDAERGLVSFVARSATLRQFPSARITLELSAAEPEKRLIGRYFLDHTAFGS